MKYLELKRWDNGNVIHSGEFDSMKDLVEDAVRKGISLEGADLYGADLEGANLYGANLSEADFEEANLKWANLEGVDLRGADLSEADFEEANLKWANLEGVMIFGKSVLSLEVHSGINRDETYKHKCYAAITTQGEIFICMGCKRLTLGQWQANWKNNKKEFPPGSRKERQRRAVYDYLVTWAKIEVERLDTIYKRNPNGSFILEGVK